MRWGLKINLLCFIVAEGLHDQQTINNNLKRKQLNSVAVVEVFLRCWNLFGGLWIPIVLQKKNSRGMNRFHTLLAEIEGIHLRMLSRKLREPLKCGRYKANHVRKIRPASNIVGLFLGSWVPVMHYKSKWGVKNQRMDNKPFPSKESASTALRWCDKRTLPNGIRVAGAR